MKRDKYFKALAGIENQLNAFGMNEIKRWARMYPREVDFRIAQDGNLLVYYDQVRDFYVSHGYKSVSKMENDALWMMYKTHVGFVASVMMMGEEPL